MLCGAKVGVRALCSLLVLETIRRTAAYSGFHIETICQCNSPSGNFSAREYYADFGKIPGGFWFHRAIAFWQLWDRCNLVPICVLNF